MNFLIGFFVITQSITALVAQEKIKCLYNKTYTVTSENPKRVQNDYAMACFNQNVFCFQTSLTGIVYFEIQKDSLENISSRETGIEKYKSVPTTAYKRGDYTIYFRNKKNSELTIEYEFGSYTYTFQIEAEVLTDSADGFTEYLFKKTQILSHDTTVRNTPNTSPFVHPGNGIFALRYVEVNPEYSQGDKALFNFIQKNVRYPASAREGGISGKCFIRFIVLPDGKIMDLTLLKGVKDCPDCDNEALRVVRLTDYDWTAGKQNGKPVPAFFWLPISFRIN